MFKSTALTNNMKTFVVQTYTIRVNPKKISKKIWSVQLQINLRQLILIFQRFNSSNLSLGFLPEI